MCGIVRYPSICTDRTLICEVSYKDTTRAESRARYDLPNRARRTTTISPLFKGDTALEHYEAGLPNAYCAPWRHAGVAWCSLTQRAAARARHGGVARRT